MGRYRGNTFQLILPHPPGEKQIIPVYEDNRLLVKFDQLEIYYQKHSLIITCILSKILIRLFFISTADDLKEKIM